jgi:hypothetical protein
MNTRSRWIVVAVILASAVAFLAFRSEGPGRPRPPEIPREDPSKHPKLLRFSPASLDFGEIALGQARTLILNVENSGAKPITIYRVIFACVCLSGGGDAVVVGPGQTVPIEVRFTGLPGKRSWVTTAGVITDEPGASKYDVPISGLIRQDFLLEPEIVSLGRCDKGESRSAEIRIRRRDGAEFALTDIKASRPEFSFAWVHAEPGKKTGYRITATAQALASGAIADTAVIGTDPAADGAPQLTLSLDVNSDVRCDPPVARAAIGSAGLPSAFDVLLRHKNGIAVKVTAVQESRENPVDFQAAEAPGGATRLTLRFKGQLPAGPPVGSFLIHVEGETEPVQLPYRVEGAGTIPVGPP